MGTIPTINKPRGSPSLCSATLRSPVRFSLIQVGTARNRLNRRWPTISRKLPAFGVASKIPTMKFLDPDTESAVRDFLARIPADVRLERAILFGARAESTGRIVTLTLP